MTIPFALSIVLSSLNCLEIVLIKRVTGSPILLDYGQIIVRRMNLYKGNRSNWVALAAGCGHSVLVSCFVSLDISAIVSILMGRDASVLSRRYRY
jgi:hypothetical protein